MNKTTNYQLNQWERTDRVLMEDFNADNAKLDAAIKAVDNRVSNLASSKANQSALLTLNQNLSKKAEIAVGTFTGDSTVGRFISVGFTPKAVLVVTEDGVMNSDLHRFGGLALAGSPAAYGQVNFIEIVSGGFKVSQTKSSGVSLDLNYYEKKYFYLAIS